MKNLIPEKIMSSHYRFVWNDLGFRRARESVRDIANCNAIGGLETSFLHWFCGLAKSDAEGRSYWTFFGLQRYFDSGLQDLHRRCLGNHLVVKVLSNPTNVICRDENQILCLGEQPGEKDYSWCDFVTLLVGHSITEKVVAYITRTGENGDEVLVFQHSKSWSEAGIQVPAGSIHPEDSLEEVTGGGIDADMIFSCYWMPIDDAISKLAGGFGDSLYKIKQN